MTRMTWKIFAGLIVGLGLAGCDRAPPAGAGNSRDAAFERVSDPAQVRDADGHYPPPPLDDSAHAWHHPTAVLLEAVREGSPEGEGKMPAWKGRLTEQQMQDVVAYIKSLWSDEVYALWLKMERQSLEP